MARLSTARCETLSAMGAWTRTECMRCRGDEYAVLDEDTPDERWGQCPMCEGEGHAQVVTLRAWERTLAQAWLGCAVPAEMAVPNEYDDGWWIALECGETMEVETR